MTWVRTDDNAPNHPKFFRSGVAAFGWWSAGLAYCNRLLTDGFIPTTDVTLVFPGTPLEDVVSLIEILVREGLLHRVDPGVRIECSSAVCRRVRRHESGLQMHDYLTFQPSKSRVVIARRIKSQAGRKGGESRAKRVKQVLEAQSKLLLSPHPILSEPILSHPKKTLTTLSGSPNGAHPTPYRQQALELLEFLNQKTGRGYRAVDANLRLLEARLKSGATVDDVRGVIARKVREWGQDGKMAAYLRPATLFNATNFESYLGMKGDGA